MPTGPCPVCRSPITIAEGQESLVCKSCGTGYKVIRQEGKIRLRRAEVARAQKAQPGAARPRQAGAAAKRRTRPAAPPRRSNRAFYLAVTILALILVLGIVGTLLIIATRPASAEPLAAGAAPGVGLLLFLGATTRYRPQL